MRVETLLPFSEGCAHRQAALEYVLPRHRYPVRLCYGDTPWIKANALNPAIRNSHADILVVADADVWTDGIPAAVEAVGKGASWAIPHRPVRRLTESASKRLAAGERWNTLPLETPPYIGVAGGGCLVAHTEVLRSVPFDPRFVGWGGEDIALGIALLTLVGRPWRGNHPLLHLWHPPQPGLTRRNQGARHPLYRRYAAARKKPRQMRALLNEFDPANQPHLHDHSPLGVGRDG